MKAPRATPDRRLCSCKNVSRDEVRSAIVDASLCTVGEVGKVTGAGTKCGSCRPAIERLIARARFSEGALRDDPPVCGCSDHGHDAIRAYVNAKGPSSVDDVVVGMSFRSPAACPRCRAAILYYLRCAYPDIYVEETSALVPNERLHANIQRDGTFSVVPRMFGGQTTPRQLRVLADVAERYGVRQMKITGGQRIDLLGVAREHLPAMWRDLGAAGFVSGHAYARGVRTVKTCVGDEWCRFGVGDAARVGVELEEMCWGSPTPHKVKMAVSGCVRNCAEATVKDLGVVSVDDGWDIYVGGTAGLRVRAADRLARVGSERSLLEHVGAFLQLYREEGRYLERTAAFVERVSADYVRERIAKDPAVRTALFKRFVKSQRREQKDPWADRARGVSAHDYVPVSHLVRRPVS